MKILIAYASAGGGHKKAALALYAYLKNRDKDIICEVVDVLEYSNFFFKKIYSWGYTFLISHDIWLWRVIFFLSSLKILGPINRRLNPLSDKLNTQKFIKLLIKENPDCFISTHFLPSEIASFLKKNHKINSKIITIITDFGVHPFWIAQFNDIYCVASTYTKNKLLSLGVSVNKIKFTGIPVDAKFLKHYEKDALIKKLDIETNKFTVLVITGSFGIGPIEKIARLLYKDVQVLAVCAQNKGLYLKLKKKNYPQVKVYGFANNVEELMAVSDMIITKPGGLTISETLAMELAPVFISSIPGQETENVAALSTFGIGVAVKDINQIKGIVLDYKNHPEKLMQIRENIRKIRTPSALEDIYDVIR